MLHVALNNRSGERTVVAASLLIASLWLPLVPVPVLAGLLARLQERPAAGFGARRTVNVTDGAWLLVELDPVFRTWRVC